MQYRPSISISAKENAEEVRGGGRGWSDKRFEIECPVQFGPFAYGDFRLDVRDLDAWIDSLRVRLIDRDSDAIVDKLGSRA
jgi:hypothetical protein